MTIIYNEILYGTLRLRGITQGRTNLEDIQVSSEKMWSDPQDSREAG
jgi:hypothetical protein